LFSCYKTDAFFFFLLTTFEKVFKCPLLIFYRSIDIGIFGRRNYGKSSLINTLANQDIAIVSDIAGTTTDPVKKSMEIADLGPVIFVDTAGIDDNSNLGKERIKKSLLQISQIDLAILVIVDNVFESF
jgi:small GTP-binding protein